MSISCRLGFAVLGCLTVLLSGCSAGGDKSADTPRRPLRGAVAGSGRGRLLKDDPPPPPHQPSQAELDESRYPPGAIQLANQVRPWEMIDVPGTGIKGSMKTRWVHGVMTTRVALFGPREPLTTFQNNIQRFHLYFKDASGSQVEEFTLNPADFKWEPPSANGGIPTLAMESSVEWPLENYQRCTNWDLRWDYPTGY